MALMTTDWEASFPPARSPKSRAMHSDPVSAVEAPRVPRRPRAPSGPTALAFALLVLTTLEIACHAWTARGTSDAETRFDERRLDVARAWRADAALRVMHRFVPSAKDLDGVVTRLDAMKLGIADPIGTAPIAGAYGGGYPFVMRISIPEPGRVTGVVDWYRTQPPSRVATFEGAWVDRFATVDVDAFAIGKHHVPLSMPFGDPSITLGQAFSVLQQEPVTEYDFLSMPASFFNRAKGPTPPAPLGVDPVVRGAMREAARAATAKLDGGLVRHEDELERARAMSRFFGERAASERAGAPDLHGDEEDRKPLAIAAWGLALATAVVGAAFTRLTAGRRVGTTVAVIAGALAAVIVLDERVRVELGSSVDGARDAEAHAFDARADVASANAELDALRSFAPAKASLDRLDERLLPIEARAQSRTRAAITPGVYVSILDQIPIGTYRAIRATGIETVQVTDHFMPADGNPWIDARLEGTAANGSIDVAGIDREGRAVRLRATIHGDVLDEPNCVHLNPEWYVEGPCKFRRDPNPEIERIVAQRPAAITRALQTVHQAVVTRARSLVPCSEDDVALADRLAAATARAAIAVDGRDRAAADLAEKRTATWRLDALRWFAELALGLVALLAAIRGVADDARVAKREATDEPPACP